MSITLEPTKIKETLYLRIPKDIADLTEVKDSTKFSLKIKNNGKKQSLEYQIK